MPISFIVYYYYYYCLKYWNGLMNATGINEGLFPGGGGHGHPAIPVWCFVWNIEVFPYLLGSLWGEDLRRSCLAVETNIPLSIGSAIASVCSPAWCPCRCFICSWIMYLFLLILCQFVRVYLTSVKLFTDQIRELFLMFRVVMATGFDLFVLNFEVDICDYGIQEEPNRNLSLTFIVLCI